MTSKKTPDATVASKRKAPQEIEMDFVFAKLEKFLNDDSVANIVGNMIVDELHLKPIRRGQSLIEFEGKRYKTSGGSKTAIGVARTIVRIMAEGHKNNQILQNGIARFKNGK